MNCNLFNLNIDFNVIVEYYYTNASVFSHVLRILIEKYCNISVFFISRNYVFTIQKEDASASFMNERMKDIFLSNDDYMYNVVEKQGNVEETKKRILYSKIYLV